MHIYRDCNLQRECRHFTEISLTFLKSVNGSSFPVLRRNYYKATLCQLSDILFHAAENRDPVENIILFLNVFTEKKVEVFYSVFKRFVKN